VYEALIPGRFDQLGLRGKGGGTNVVPAVSGGNLGENIVSKASVKERLGAIGVGASIRGGKDRIRRRIDLASVKTRKEASGG